MSGETMKEIIKAFSYGCTDEQVAEVVGMSTEDAAEFREQNAGAIVAKQNELREAGYLDE